jgi:hypothetical protein
VWGPSIETPMKKGLGRSHPYENSDLMAQKNAFFLNRFLYYWDAFLYMYQLLLLIETMPSKLLCYGKLNITQLINFLNKILLNNFKWQYLVGECKMDFPVATRIPSCENSFWIYLLDSIITVHVRHRLPAQVIFSHYNPDKKYR